MSEFNGSDIHQGNASFALFCKREDIQDLTARYYAFFQTEEGAKLERKLSMMAAEDRGGTLSTLEYRNRIKFLSVSYDFPIDDVVLMFRFRCELLCDGTRRFTERTS